MRITATDLCKYTITIYKCCVCRYMCFSTGGIHLLPYTFFIILLQCGNYTCHTRCFQVEHFLYLEWINFSIHFTHLECYYAEVRWCLNNNRRRVPSSLRDLLLDIFLFKEAVIRSCSVPLSYSTKYMWHCQARLCIAPHVVGKAIKV